MTEPEEYGPTHEKFRLRDITVGDVYGGVIGLAFILIVLIVCWAVSKQMRGITNDVKVIKNELVNVPPLSFNDQWKNDISELIKQARALNETLEATTHSVNNVALKVGALDYSMSGLESAVGGVENQLVQIQVRDVRKPPKPAPAKPKAKVTTPSLPVPGRSNGPNHPVP